MRIVFVGTGDIGVPALRALTNSDHQLVAVVTQPDKPVGRDQRIQPPPIKQAVAGSDIPVFQPNRIKDAAAIEQIRSLQPDVIVVMAYGQILPAGVLTAPRIACVNLHASLLPRWRGAAPIQAAIAAGDTLTGITVMYVNEGLDSGDILLKREVQISPQDTGGSLHDRLAELARSALSEALPLLANGNAPRIPQDSAEVTYAPKLNRESGRIDWTVRANVIARRIRAFNPWPGAFTEFKTSAGPRKLKVFSGLIADQQGSPGQILANDQELIIAAGAGAVSLTEVQLEGRKRMSAAEFVRGNQWIREAVVNEAA
jgi:methionyl-tRNA formyltransferase